MAAQPARKMTLGEIRRKANAGALSDAEIKRIFVIDEAQGKPLEPCVDFNPDVVEFKGFKAKPGEAAVLLAKAGETRRRMPPKGAAGGPESATARKAAPRIKVLAEGDSWFNLPYLIMPRTAMDVLARTHDVLNLAMWGDELRDMVKAGQYRQPLGSGNFGHFFLSGGGNDVLGAIPKYVAPRKPDDSNPANAANYIRPTYGQQLDAVMKDYGKVADIVPAKTVLYVHGYAYAIPVAGGKHLGTPLQTLGFDPIEHSALARAVVARMVDLFNQRLMQFAASRAGVVWIDLRPVLSATDWHTDEIHPAAPGADKIAKRFRAALAAQGPVA